MKWGGGGHFHCEPQSTGAELDSFGGQGLETSSSSLLSLQVPEGLKSLRLKLSDTRVGEPQI